MTAHDDEVRRSFAAHPQDYVASPPHAAGPDLAWLLEELQPQATDLALDVATGTGHAALALAQRAHRVAAVDLTAEMLAAARELAAGRGASNVVFAQARAEALPFPDGLFDLVCCRIAAHHFGDPDAAIREMARMLAPEGRLALIDNVAPDDPELDAWLNAFDRLRDPSHVRALTSGAWLVKLRAAGLDARVVHTWDSPMDLPRWAASAPDPDAVHRRLAAAPAAVRALLAVDGPHFRLRKAMLVARRPAERAGPS